MGHVRPHVVGIGGALRQGSTSDAALGWILRSLADRGCKTETFSGASITFSAYDPAGSPTSDDGLEKYLQAVRSCDALVISSPVYHGGPSGLIKNAIDHLQPLMDDRRPYLTGRPICCIAAGGGLTGAVATLAALRHVVHSLRGWPIPMQVPINSSSKPFDAIGSCSDPKLERTLLAARDDLLSFLHGTFAMSSAA